MEPWKNTLLLPPPVHTTKIEGLIDLAALKEICNNCASVLSKQSPLHQESALLSRFLYKYDKKFRNDIGYRNIRKTNSTLRKYLQINLLGDVESFMAVLSPEDNEYMPTRQMLEYVLVRLITFSKLILRICVCSKQAAIFYLDRVKRGESHWMSLMPYALLSRIWSMSSVLLQHTISWYSSLYYFLGQLHLKGLNFLPVSYELPVNLADWLDIKNLDTFGKFDWCQKKSMEIGVFIDDEDAFDNILNYAKQINEDKETTLENTPFISAEKVVEQLPIAKVTKLDNGQAISRDHYKMLMKSVSKENKEYTKDDNEMLEVDKGQPKSEECIKILTNFQKKMSNTSQGTHYFGKVTNSKSLENFLDIEESFRNDGNKQSLTSHLSFMQWQTLKIALRKVCDSITNRKLDRKLQKVWREKCLDYLDL